MRAHHTNLGIYFEHPTWFELLFAELDRRGLEYEQVPVDGHTFDPAARPPFRAVFNRMSPSAPQRGRLVALAHTSHWLQHLEAWGVRVINGSRAWAVETSKALQISLMARLGLSFPAARVIQRAEDAPQAAEALRFPVLVKPNVGGSGAGIERFDRPADLAEQAAAGTLDLGPDRTALVQEFVPRDAGRIVRVEFVGGKFLYAIRIYASDEAFNLCPADACQPESGNVVERYTPPPEIVEAVGRLLAAADIDVGGVEYLIDERDGRPLFYDVNALSNFVADAPNVIGLDPFARLVDWLVGTGAAVPCSTLRPVITP